MWWGGEVEVVMRKVRCESGEKSMLLQEGDLFDRR